jgi:alkylation response protein AidB-like acyl-CoA dehydrogenase
VDFGFSPEQQAVLEAASKLLSDKSSPESLVRLEKSSLVFDRDLWGELARAGLLCLAIPERYGGAGLTILEGCVLLVEQGKNLSPVPLLPNIVAGLILSKYANEHIKEKYLPSIATGEIIASVGLPSLTIPDEYSMRSLFGSEFRIGHQSGYELSGMLSCVRGATISNVLIVPFCAQDSIRRIAVVDVKAPGVQIERIVTTDLQESGAVYLGNVRVMSEDIIADENDDPLRLLVQSYSVGVCALQYGVCDQAVKLTARYVSERHQFGKPLASFQAVALRAADAFIDSEAIGATMWNAAWNLSEGYECESEVQVAKWWASEAGHRVIHAVQHLHGGMGADITYPIHRFFLWGKQLDLEIGSGPLMLARLGRALVGK